jgi:hypothetical protein
VVNIKIDLREIRLDGVDWVDLAEDRNQGRPLVNTAMNINCREVHEWLHNWRLLKKGSGP